jgi:hypothetical protein
LISKSLIADRYLNSKKKKKKNSIKNKDEFIENLEKKEIKFLAGLKYSKR